MLWDGMWDRYEKRVARQPHKVWADLAATVIEYTRRYFKKRGRSLPVKVSVLNTIDALCTSVVAHQRMSRDEETTFEVLINEFGDDDRNSEAPGVWDLLSAIEFFLTDRTELSADDLGDCLSFCYQCIYGIEILKPMKVGASYSEDELEVKEAKVPACIEGVEFQAAAIRKVLGIDK